MSKSVNRTSDPLGVSCAECGRDVDEFTAIAEKWRYWSDGVGELIPFCPECARREFALYAAALTRASEGD